MEIAWMLVLLKRESSGRICICSLVLINMSTVRGAVLSLFTWQSQKLSVDIWGLHTPPVNIIENKEEKTKVSFGMRFFFRYRFYCDHHNLMGTTRFTISVRVLRAYLGYVLRSDLFC